MAISMDSLQTISQIAFAFNGVEGTVWHVKILFERPYIGMLRNVKLSSKN